jgi:hypothetical protein
VQVISGPGPDSFHGRFAAVADIDEEFVLLDSEDENVPICGGEIKLSRCVFSVVSFEKLRISVKAQQGGRVFRGGVDFTPQGMGAKLSDTISASARWNSPSIGPFSLTVRLS